MKNNCFVRNILFLFLFVSNIGLLYSQQQITGRVVDENKDPVIGATIRVKGSDIGTVTDFEGNYILNTDLNSDILIISYVGMKTIEVGVSQKMFVVLEQDYELLDELVVVGYGTVKKSDLTGSVSSVKSEDLNKGVVVSLEQALQGKISGVQINQTSSEPGGGVAIRIRGVNSITGGDEPLYVVDGMPINNSTMFSGGGGGGIPVNTNPKNPLNSLNTNDIESVEVLKDASATAIYGARGANGVILITTKKGSKSKLNINVDTYSGVQEIYKHLDILSTEEYIKAMNELKIAEFSNDQIQEIGKGTYWPEVVTRKAFVNNNNISLSGGSENTQYFISANFMKQDGIIRGTDTQRFSFRANMNHEFNDRISIGFNLTNSLNHDNHSVEGVGNTELGPYYTATIFDPTLPVYQQDGSLTISEHLTHPNPLFYSDQQTAHTKTSRVLGTFFLDFKLTDNIFNKIRVGYDQNNGRQDLFKEYSPVSAGSLLAAADVSHLEQTSNLLEYSLNYQKEYEKWHVIGLLGVTYEEFINRSFGVSVSDFPTDVLSTNNLGLGNKELASIRSNKDKNSLLSYLFRINLSLYDKVLFTSSFRVDGSSRFGENNKYASFPSLALAYKLNEENFIPNLFNEFKLRTSWGSTGNQNIGNYASLSTYSLGGEALLGGSLYRGTQASRLANPNLKWETTTQYNIGMDVGILNGRISVSVDYFIKDTKDMLMNFPLPPSSGFNSILRNIGSMRNSGTEITLNTRNFVNKDFNWTTSIAFTAMKNRVTNIGNLDQITTGNFFTSSFGIIKPGEPLNAYYTYKVIGIFSDENEVASSAQPTSKPGYPKYLDANEDGKIDANDRVIVGKPWPDFTYGITNKINFKNWNLDIYINGQQGAELLNGNIVYSMHPVSPRMNRMRDMIINRWTPENTDTKWPSAINPEGYGATKINSLAVEDASFIKLQSVQLGYNFALKNLNWIENLNIYLTGQNLLTLTKYSGLNPESNKNGQGNIWADRNSYPMARTYILGINLQF